MLSISLALVITLTNGYTSFASNDSYRYKEKIYSYTLSEGQSQEEISKELNRAYENLGLGHLAEKVRQEKQNKGAKLVSQEIYIIHEPTSLANNIKSGFNLMSRSSNECNTARIVEVKDHYIYPSTDILNKRNSWEEALDKYINIGLGFTKAWIWVPASIIDFSPISGGMDWLTGRDITRDDKLKLQLSEEITYKYGQALDVNNRFPNTIWYAFSMAKKCDLNAQLTLTAFDKNHRLRTAYGEKEKRNIKSPKYDDNSFLKEKAMDAYNGYGPEYIEGFEPKIKW